MNPRDELREINKTIENIMRSKRQTPLLEAEVARLLARASELCPGRVGRA